MSYLPTWLAVGLMNLSKIVPEVPSTDVRLGFDCICKIVPNYALLQMWKFFSAALVAVVGIALLRAHTCQEIHAMWVGRIFLNFGWQQCIAKIRRGTSLGMRSHVSNIYL